MFQECLVYHCKDIEIQGQVTSTKSINLCLQFTCWESISDQLAAGNKCLGQLLVCNCDGKLSKQNGGTYSFQKEECLVLSVVLVVVICYWCQI